MKNVITQRCVLGMLMMCVMVLGVVGVADALTLTPVSDRVQSKLEDSTFEITFSVGLKSPAARYTTSGPRRLVNSGTPADSTVTPALTANPEGTDFIDSQGYELAYLADGRSLRVIHATPGYVPSTGTRVILTNNVRPSYANQPFVADTSTDPTTYTAGAATLNLPTETTDITRVDASGYAYTTAGVPVYVQSGTGARNNPGTPANENDPYTYQRLRALPQDPLHIYDRFDYNNEQISITFTDGTTNHFDKLRDKRDGQPLHETTDATIRTMSETDFYAQLRSSVTLVTDPLPAGTYTITITDSTPDDDFPVNQVPSKQSITFTFYVQTDTAPTGTLTFADSAAGNLKKLSTTLSVVPISTHFNLDTADPALPANTSIRYQVAVGSGRVYVGTPDREDTTPVRDLTIHKDSAVYLKTNGTTNEVIVVIAGQDPRTHGKTLVFEYTGSGGSTGGTGGNTGGTDNRVVTPPSTTPSLTLSSTTISGAAGSTQSIIATVRRGTSAAPGIGVTFQVGSLTPVTVTANSNGQASHTFTLPSASTTLSVSANVLGTVVSGSVQLTVSGTTGTGAQTGTTTETGGTPSRLIIDGDEDIDGERNSSEELVVRVVDRNGDGVTGVPVRFRTTEGSGRFSPSLARTDNSGYANVRFTPTSDGDIEIQVSSGTLASVYFTISTGEPPHALKKISGDNQSGRTGERLANPFIVEVVDENDDPVSGATVTFSVTGGGSLSTERVTTNGTGRAQTTLRLGDTPGNQTVTARVAGVSEGVAFTARAGAQILVDASQRAPLYWVNTQQGTLHRLVSDAVENLASRTRGITSLVVDTTNGILYFGVNLDGKRGEIRRSGLTGRNVQSVKTGINVPVDIALDATGETLYWATANGKVKSQPTEGSTRGTNILDNLADPRGIVVSDGFLYWSESLGRLRRLNLTDPEANVETLVTGLGEPLSLAIGRGKMYWTEQGARGGLLQRANLDGSNVEELKPFTGGVPTGLAIDVDDRKLYWTRPQGKIERSNLMGRSVRDIVTGLVSPGAIALAGPVPDAEPVAERPTRTTTTTDSTDTTKTAADSKYDLNGDRKVNSKDVDAILLAVLAGLDLAKYDVNGDGSVDVEDIKAVNDAAIGDAAAPTIHADVTGLDLDPNGIQKQIDQLIASGDTSLAAQRVLAYFQHLLASLRPDETVLLANYPNPFNPETWIPYHLAIGTDVQVNIYNAQGTLVRTLTLGHQTAGYYTSRSRAAYWDGRNAIGERVASGIYFYQLQTDEVSPMRKMVILK